MNITRLNTKRPYPYSSIIVDTSFIRETDRHLSGGRVLKVREKFSGQFYTHEHVYAGHKMPNPFSGNMKEIPNNLVKDRMHDLVGLGWKYENIGEGVVTYSKTCPEGVTYYLDRDPVCGEYNLSLETNMIKLNVDFNWMRQFDRVMFPTTS